MIDQQITWEDGRPLPSATPESDPAGDRGIPTFRPAVDRSGTPGNDVIGGTEEANTLRGLRGVDELFGEDDLFGGTENNILHGGAEVDRVFGDAGRDHLFVEGGVDTLVGGADSNIDFVDASDEAVNEDPDEGGDEVRVAVTFALPVNVEVLSFLRSLIIALLLSFAWVGAAAAAIQSFALPDALPANDDSSSAAVAIGFPINFFGVTHTQLFVNNNGNVTFGAPLSAFTPFGLVGTQTAIIAPFFADVDTRGAGSGVVRFGTPSGRSDLFVVDWVSVGYFNQKDDKLNSFQLILQDLSAVPDFAPGDFRIIFNYDQIRWETGDASGGTNGLGGSSARVGFSNGSGQSGTFFELTGSGQNGALLDGGSRSLVGNKVPPADPDLPRGRYQFVVQNGAVAQADLAIAAEIIEDEDVTGFALVVRNFGPSDAIPVQATFELRGGGRRARIRSIRPRQFCEVDDTFGLQPPREATCNFPSIANGRSQRIRVITSEAVRGDATVASNVFDSDLSNNRARASSSCRGEILSRSAPESVLYEPTATEPARQTLRLAIINTADDQSVEIRSIRLEDIYTDPIFGTPLQISSIAPPLPAPIPPSGSQLFRVATLVPAGMPARTAFRPYFQIRVRCPP